MKKLLFLLILALVVVLLLPACAQPSPQPPAATPAATKPAPQTSPAAPAAPSPQYGGVWKMILTGPIGNIVQLGAQFEVTGGMYPRVSRPAIETLWKYDNNEKIVPKLAESFEVTSDGKTMTIKLRKGIKFHDGTPWNAQALTDNLQMTKDSKVNAAYATSLFKDVSGWEVADEYSVKVSFKTFDAKFLTMLAERHMVSPTAARIPSTPENMAKDHMIGTGPFKFVGYQRDQYAKYTVKNENYWQTGKPYLDGIEMNQIADSVTALISFKKGDAQLLFGIGARDANDLKSSGFEIWRSGVNMINYIIPAGANKDSPWSKLKVRQAAEYAIDKKAIATLGSGFYNPVTQFANPGDARYVPELAPRNYDPAKAKALLAEAGYPAGFKSTLIAGTGYNREILVALQTYLKEAGIDCTLDIIDSARGAEVRTKGWGDGILTVGVPLVGPLQSFFTSLGSSVYPTMYRGDFQKVMDSAIAEPDYDKRMGYIKGLVKLLYDDSMAIPLWSAPDISAVDTKVLKGDIQWMMGHPNFFEPQNAWLSK